MSPLEQAQSAEEQMMGDLPWLAPLAALFLAAVGGVLIALLVRREDQWLAGLWVGLMHLAAAGAAAGVWVIGGPRLTMSGSYAVDGLTLAVTVILGLAGAISVALLRPAVAGERREGELYGVLAATTLAGVILSGAADIALIALAISMLGIGPFVMTAFRSDSRAGGEAGIKYYIYATVAGATMVYGLTWWYGLAGSTSLASIGAALGSAPTAAVVGAGALVLVGFGYKAAAVPFHFWTPDVYEGAPIPVAAYISVVPKLAAIAGLARVLTLALPGDLVGWSTAIAVVAAATMLFGVVAMIPQRSAVRLLAYSSISQTGFMLIAVAALPGSVDATRSLVFFFASYAVANLAAFAVVLAVARETGSADVDALAGLGRRHPWWTAALVLAVLSLFGLPPLGGFVAKLTVFGAAIDAGQAWLAVLGIVATVISLYPYLRMIAPAILSPRPDRRPAVQPPALGRVLGPALAVTAGASLLFGVAAQPLLEVARDSTAMPVTSHASGFLHGQHDLLLADRPLALHPGEAGAVDRGGGDGDPGVHRQGHRTGSRKVSSAH
ncbi:MAG: NADH-quinone oxidoreductase subunit N [Actinobacteria bacterium]|nr:NADH-quinone oxidoreductase subunit N [Actinomycetota bacterium]